MSFKDKNQPQNDRMANAVTASNQYPYDQKDEDEIPEKDRKGHVDPYQKPAEFPFEKDEVVWIVKPEYRAPLGEFSIVRAHPDDLYELVRRSDNTPHPNLIEGKYLRRNI